jgi:competence protein ComEC
LIWVAEHGSSVEGGAISWPAGLSGAVLLIVVSGLLWRMLRGGIVLRLLAVVVVGVLLLQIPIRAIVQSWPPHGLIFLACDVGQGDGLILPVNATSAVVVDAGPDPVPIARCLDELGVTDVPLVVLTHLHMDHVAGLTGVFHDRQVHRVITGPLAAPETGQRLVTDVLARHGMRLGTIAMGEAFDFSSLHLDVLGPREAFRGTRSDPNNSSVILRATIGSARLLLLGDAELEAQQQLLDDHVDLRADVVKVAHHGSAYSLPAVLEQTGARLGIISVGANNDFGHPAPLTLGMLSRLGIEVKRTDRDGDIALVSEGGTLHCVTRRSAILVP